MSVFWLLTLAYLLAEYTLQTRRFLAWKERRAHARAVQTAFFFLTALALTWPYLNETWFSYYGANLSGAPSLVIISLLFAYGSYEFDKINLKKIPYVSSLLYLFRPFYKLLVFFVFSPASEMAECGSFWPAPWILVVCGALVLAKMTEWFLFYFEKDVCYGANHAACPLPTPDVGFISTLQREGLFFIMLIPGYSFVVFLVMWLWCSVYARKIRIIDISYFSLYSGSVIAILLGLAVRSVRF